MKYKYLLLVLFASIITNTELYSQVWDPQKGCVVDPDGDCLENTVATAVPFLTIIPDSRSGGMGDAGIAITPDANAMHFNASKLAFSDNRTSLSATYTPWLRNIGVNDVYLAYLSGYRKIDDLQAVGASLKFFSLGDIEFTDTNGGTIGEGRPREFEIAAAYARKLGESFSASLSAKYIYSNLAAGQEVNSFDISAANSFAVDLGLYYFHDVTLGEIPATFRYGLAVTNVGSKVSYLEGQTRDFIPTNFGLGTAMDLELNDYNVLTLTLDVKKLMAPTPVSSLNTEEYDVSPANGVADWREKSLFEGILGSFTDAPTAREELQEIYYSLGIEYWYAEQFALRMGYYYENQLKGSRQFLTAGFGLRYNIYEMNLSYLVPTSNARTPLDNTLRFSIHFNFGSADE